jgi:hypothetical protein
MEMKTVNAANLRAIGYDAARRVLVVQLSSGTFEFANVSSEVWRRFSQSGNVSSFYRDNIEEEFAKKRIK